MGVFKKALAGSGGSGGVVNLSVDSQTSSSLDITPSGGGTSATLSAADGTGNAGLFSDQQFYQQSLLNDYGIILAADEAARFALASDTNYTDTITAAGGISSQPIYVYQIDQATYYQVIDAGNLGSELGYRVAGGTFATLVATGTVGTDFAISPSGDTYVFNLPDASPIARGVVTTGSQTFGGEKVFNGGIKSFRPVVSVTGTSKTLALTDNWTRQKCSNASTQTLTVPTNASVAFPIDQTEIELSRLGAGSVTIQGDTGVTINGVSAGSVTISSQYQSAVLIKSDTNVWYVSGAI